MLLQSPSVHDVDQREMFCLYLFPGNQQTGKVGVVVISVLLVFYVIISSFRFFFLVCLEDFSSVFLSLTSLFYFFSFLGQNGGFIHSYWFSGIINVYSLKSWCIILNMRNHDFL